MIFPFLEKISVNAPEIKHNTPKSSLKKNTPKSFKKYTSKD
jgi:hypothetical protein